MGREQERQARPRQAQRSPQCRSRPITTDCPARQQRRHHRREEYEIDEAELHRTEGQRRTHQDEVHISEGADESEENAESDAERGAQLCIAQVLEPAREGRGAKRHGPLHRRRARDGKVDQDGACKIERREEIEMPSQTQVIGQGRRNQATDQVAGDVAGDIGGERAPGIRRAAFLPEIGQRQCESRRHAQSLHHAQGRERHQIRGDCQ